jgi:hypothetical protein
MFDSERSDMMQPTTGIGVNNKLECNEFIAAKIMTAENIPSTNPATAPDGTVRYSMTSSVVVGS